MRIHRTHLFGLTAVLVGSLALGSGCVVEDDDGSMADHPEGGSSSQTGGAAGSSDDGVGGTSETGGDGGAEPTAGAAGAEPTAGAAGAEPTAGAAGAPTGTAGAAGGSGAPAEGGAGGAEPAGGGSDQGGAGGGSGAPAEGGAAGGTATAGAGGVAGATACFGDSANGGFDCNQLPGADVVCPVDGGAGAGGAGGAGGASDGLMLYGVDLCLSLAADGRQGIAEAFYNCVNEISPAECSTTYDSAVVACQDSVTQQACESSAATEACGRINCTGCSDILILWTDSVIADIESCYMDLRTADPSGDCLDQLKDAEAGIGCD